MVYKVSCLDCDFVSYGQTETALATRIKEHRRAVRVGDSNSKIAQHANQVGHSMDFDHTTIVDKARDYPRRHSQGDQNAGNEHIEIPDIYKLLA